MDGSKSRKIVVARQQSSCPLEEDFRLIEEELKGLEDGEVLVEAEYITIDACQRAAMRKMAIGETIIGSQVAKVLESKNEKFKEGDFIVGNFGWRTKAVINPDKEVHPYPVYKLPDISPFDRSLALGPLGIPGNTAFFGFLEICQPKEGQVVVVSSAASSIGSHVGQIAKIYKCFLIGITGGDENCDLIKRAYGFDASINYQKENVDESLKKLAPKGVDIYFDNIGGPISTSVIQAMNPFGRISVCSAASAFFEDFNHLPRGPYLQPDFIAKQLKMEGFSVFRWADRWLEGIEQNLNWIKDGKIKYKQKIYENFDQMPHIMAGIYRSNNMAQCIIKVNDFGP